MWIFLAGVWGWEGVVILFIMVFEMWGGLGDLLGGGWGGGGGGVGGGGGGGGGGGVAV